MERKIGEIFEHKGEWYQCVEGTGCYQCAFNQDADTCLADNPHCTSRSDGKDVIFKRLEKVGKPYEFDGHIFQAYHTFAVPIFTENYATVREFGNNSKISIEIKQNKEDTMEETKLNIKPFSLEAAKAGKPVCTRGGRKARIICFDAKDDNYPLVVAVTNRKGKEDIIMYTSDGHFHTSRDDKYDLMMLPEKKEGWINVYKSKDTIFKSEKEAKAHSDDFENYIATIKIEWEE